MNDTLTYKDIAKAMREIEKLGPKPMDNPFAYKPMHFGGMPIYEVKDRVYPKIQLTESFADKYLTVEAKERINSKLIEMLGMRVVKTIPDGTAYMFSGGIMARPENIAMIINTTA